MNDALHGRASLSERMPRCRRLLGERQDRGKLNRQ